MDWSWESCINNSPILMADGGLYYLVGKELYLLDIIDNNTSFTSNELNSHVLDHLTSMYYYSIEI